MIKFSELVLGLNLLIFCLIIIEKDLIIFNFI